MRLPIWSAFMALLVLNFATIESQAIYSEDDGQVIEVFGPLTYEQFQQFRIPRQLRPHPLDPLSAAEIERTSQIINSLPPARRWAYITITLREPPKAQLFPILNSGTSDFSRIPRKSFSVLVEMGTRDVYEAVVNLDTNQVESLTLMPPGTIPALTRDSVQLVERVAKADPKIQQRMNELGYAVESVQVEPWPVGYIGDKSYNGRRLSQVYFYGEQFRNDNVYAHPLDFRAIVDIDEQRVIDIEGLPVHDQYTVRNRNQGVTVPSRPYNYDSTLPGFDHGQVRSDLRPLEISQPQGASFSIQGNLVTWQKFQFRVGFNYREGLVLHNILFEDKGKIRSILYRAALSEMMVPYADPRPPFHRKQAFDAGEGGIGVAANTLVPGEDCIGVTSLFSAQINTQEGRARELRNVVCMSESDDGILWKHTSGRNNRTNIARSRRLTLTYISTISNYEYIFLWHFYQDATIRFEVRASGELSTELLAEGSTPFGFGTVVLPQVTAQYHQHFVTVRLDPMVDGIGNTVSTLDVVPVDGNTGSATNKYGNGFTVRETPLRTAGQGRSDVSSKTARTWKITNPSILHPYTNSPVGWKLMTANSAGLMLKPDSPLRIRGGFAEHAVWVTPYRDDQIYAAGFYVNGTGLPEWVRADESASVENKDIVLWHTFCMTHIPRVEDFPIMPEENTGFMLKPVNFFLGNPATDVPPPRRTGGGRG